MSCQHDVIVFFEIAFNVLSNCSDIVAQVHVCAVHLAKEVVMWGPLSHGGGRHSTQGLLAARARQRPHCVLHARRIFWARWQNTDTYAHNATHMRMHMGRSLQWACMHNARTKTDMANAAAGRYEYTYAHHNDREDEYYQQRAHEKADA